MRFHEKLRRRVQELGLNKARAARDAGLPESTINNYLAKNDSLPRIDIAAKIAKAILVPLEWLADDAAEWPPPNLDDNRLDRMDDDILMFEVCSRHRRELVPLVQAIKLAEKTDWESVLRAFSGWKPGDPLPNEAKDVPHSSSLRWGIRRVQEHNPWVASQKFHAKLRGAETPFSEFKEEEVLHRWNALASMPAFLDVMRLFQADEKWTWERVREESKKTRWQEPSRGFDAPPASPTTFSSHTSPPTPPDLPTPPAPVETTHNRKSTPRHPAKNPPKPQ